MDLPISPPNWGSLKVFEAISYISLFLNLGDFKSYKKTHKIYHILFGLLLLVLFLGSLNSEFISNSLVNILSVFPIFIYSKSIINECNSDNEFPKKVIQGLKLVASISIIFLIIQIIVGLEFTFYSELNRNTLNNDSIRYPSFFPDPQKYQQFLAMLSFLFLINDKQIGQPYFKNYLLFIIVFIAMLATGSRAAMLGFLSGILLIFFALGLRSRFTIFIISIMVGSLFISSFDSLLILKRSETFNDDYEFRTSLWAEAYNIYKDHPLLGIGIGNYQNFSFTRSNNYYISEEGDVIYYDSESGYLKMLSETGSLGFIISFLFIIIPIFYSVKNIFNGNKNLIVHVFLASILSWLVSFVSLYSLYDRRILILVITFVCLLITSTNFRIKHV